MRMWPIPLIILLALWISLSGSSFFWILLLEFVWEFTSSWKQIKIETRALHTTRTKNQTSHFSTLRIFWESLTLFSILVGKRASSVHSQNIQSVSHAATSYIRNVWDSILTVHTTCWLIYDSISFFLPVELAELALDLTRMQNQLFCRALGDVHKTTSFPQTNLSIISCTRFSGGPPLFHTAMKDCI